MPPAVTTPPPDPAPVALADEATTDEDSTVVVNVLDNDTSLRVTDLDTSSTVGAVTANPDGTISYDPRGRFDELGPTELATDTFMYTAQDVADPVTVFVTVTGVDDPLVIGGVGSTALAYDTGSDALAVTPSLTLSDVDGRRARSRARRFASAAGARPRCRCVAGR